MLNLVIRKSTVSTVQRSLRLHNTYQFVTAVGGNNARPF